MGECNYPINSLEIEQEITDDLRNDIEEMINELRNDVRKGLDVIKRRQTELALLIIECYKEKIDSDELKKWKGYEDENDNDVNENV